MKVKMCRNHPSRQAGGLRRPSPPEQAARRPSRLSCDCPAQPGRGQEEASGRGQDEARCQEEARIQPPESQSPFTRLPVWFQEVSTSILSGFGPSLQGLGKIPETAVARDLVLGKGPERTSAGSRTWGFGTAKPAQPCARKWRSG